MWREQFVLKQALKFLPHPLQNSSDFPQASGREVCYANHFTKVPYNFSLTDIRGDKATLWWWMPSNGYRSESNHSLPRKFFFLSWLQCGGRDVLSKLYWSSQQRLLLHVCSFLLLRTKAASLPWISHFSREQCWLSICCWTTIPSSPQQQSNCEYVLGSIIEQHLENIFMLSSPKNTLLKDKIFYSLKKKRWLCGFFF